MHTWRLRSFLLSNWTNYTLHHSLISLLKSFNVYFLSLISNYTVLMLYYRSKLETNVHPGQVGWLLDKENFISFTFFGKLGSYEQSLNANFHGHGIRTPCTQVKGCTIFELVRRGTWVVARLETIFLLVSPITRYLSWKTWLFLYFPLRLSKRLYHLFWSSYWLIILLSLIRLTCGYHWCL
jgi:hypothetical protein